LRSVEPRQETASAELVGEVLAALDWEQDELSSPLPRLMPEPGIWCSLCSIWGGAIT
jgi:hypothetical protein